MKVTKQIEVVKIELDVAGTKLILTVDQIKELRNLLNKEFPETYPFVPVPQPYPIYIRHSEPTPWWQHQTVCGLGGQVSSLADYTKTSLGQGLTS